MRGCYLGVLFISTIAWGQVYDLNQDGLVGPHEMIGIAQNWKGTASASNEHDHFGQTWNGDSNPLTLTGPFRDLFKKSESDKGLEFVSQAPLILENTDIIEEFRIHGSDLLLGGQVGKMTVNQFPFSDMLLVSNRGIYIELDSDGDNDGIFMGHLIILNGTKENIFQVDEDGAITAPGLDLSGNKGIRIDHPSDPNNRVLQHSMVASPEMKNVYDGVTVLDENGESWVDLPDYFEAFNEAFRYQLTAIGQSAPALYVVEEISGNRFQIGGGHPGMKVSWQVTGNRKDPLAKSNPLVVEKSKSEIRKALRPGENP